MSRTGRRSARWLCSVMRQLLPSAAIAGVALSLASTAHALGGGGGGNCLQGDARYSACAEVSWQTDHVDMLVADVGGNPPGYDMALARFGMVGRGDTTQFNIDSNNIVIGRDVLPTGSLFWFIGEACSVYSNFLYETCSYWGTWSPTEYV